MQVGQQPLSHPAPCCLCLQEEPGPPSIQAGCELEGRQRLETPEFSAWRGCPPFQHRFKSAKNPQRKCPLFRSQLHISVNTLTCYQK